MSNGSTKRAPGEREQALIPRLGQYMPLRLETWWRGTRNYDNLRGPGLASVTDWFVESEEKDAVEVCYNFKGEVYMRFDPKRGEYNYPSFDEGDYVAFEGKMDVLDTKTDVELEKGVRHCERSLERDLEGISDKERYSMLDKREGMLKKIWERRNKGTMMEFIL